MFDVKIALILAVVAVIVLANIGVVWKFIRGSGPTTNPFAGATKTVESAIASFTKGKSSTTGEMIDTVEGLRQLLADRGVVTTEVASAIETIELAVLHAKPTPANAAPSQVTGV